MADINLYAEIEQEQLDQAKKEVGETVTMLRGLTEIPKPEDVSLARSTAQKVLDEARKMTVDSQETWKRATDLSTRCTQAMRAIDRNEKLQEGLVSARKLHKWFTDLVGSLQKPYKDAQGILDRKAREFTRAEQKRLDDEARKQREAEQKRLDDERLKKAETLQGQGKTEEAKEVLDRVEVAAPVQPKQAPKAAGRVEQKNWKGEVVDFKAMVQGILEGKVPWSFIVPDEAAINRVARSLEAEFNKYPGVRAYDAGKTQHREDSV